MGVVAQAKRAAGADGSRGGTPGPRPRVPPAAPGSSKVLLGHVLILSGKLKE